LSFLFLNCLKLCPNALPLKPAGGGLGSVFHVGLCTVAALLLGSLVANLGAAQFADVSLDGAAVNQRADDLLGFLVDAAAVECAINKSCSFPTLERQ
jgi:hypothetical protein